MRKPLALFALLASLFVTQALAAVPTTINYQGHLSASGGPASGLLPFHFSIYDAESGGNLLWADLDTLDVVNGLFSAQLGANTPIPTIVFNTPATWLETAVNGQVLAPRISFASVPYAQFAQHADTANVANSYTGAGQWSSDGTNVWRLNGGVGIGTQALDYRLAIEGPNGKQLVFTQGDASPWDVAAYSDNTFRVNETGIFPRLVLQAGGNIGVSTASFSGAGRPEVMIKAVDPSNAGYIGVASHDGTSSVGIRSGTGGDGSLFAFQNSIQFGATTGNGTSQFSEKMRLDASGNVGIGTSAPREKLEVYDGRILLTGSGPHDTAKLYFINTAAGGNRGWAWQALDDGAFELEEYGVANNRITVSPGGNVNVAGSLTVGGTKCRAVEGTKYGTLYYNAVESGHALFTLDGEAQLKDGVGWVQLDPKWLAGATINDSHPMQVWITFYGPHGDYYVDRANSNDGFKVIDPSRSNSAFGWKVEARQKGYEDRYLDAPGSVAKRQGHETQPLDVISSATASTAGK